MNQVWPGIAVEANNLTVQITALRRVLDGNSATASCIQTVTGRGYRFVAPISSGVSARTLAGATPATLEPLSVPLPDHGFPAGDESVAESILRADPVAGPAVATGRAEPDERRWEPRPAERRQLTLTGASGPAIRVLKFTASTNAVPRRDSQRPGNLREGLVGSCARGARFIARRAEPHRYCIRRLTRAVR
jgi:hypothetical protein